jgi:hypothetical protein
MRRVSNVRVRYSSRDG